MRIVIQMQTGVTCTEVCRSQTHFQCNSHANAGGFSCGSKKFSATANSSIRDFLRTLRIIYTHTYCTELDVEAFLVIGRA